MAHEPTDASFVKLCRKILSWQWYSEPCTRALFIHCLLKANWKPGEWQGQHYERGEFITSLASLAKDLGYSVRNIRTAIKHLKLTGEITERVTNKYRVINVVNYDFYQSDSREATSKATNNLTTDRQTSDKQVTTDKEYKNNKNIKNNIYCPNFESLWAVYPRKTEKAAAYKAYQARLNDGFSETELLQAVKNYADQCEKEHREKKYIKQCKTFLGANTPFTDYTKGGEENAADTRNNSESWPTPNEMYAKWFDSMSNYGD